jgi:hypothetical protein
MLNWANAHLGLIAVVIAAMIVASLLTERGHRPRK